MRRRLSLAGLLLAAWSSSFGASAGQDAAVSVVPERFEIAGRHVGRQLLVTAGADGPRPRDLTRDAR